MKKYILHIWIKTDTYFDRQPFYDKLRNDYNGINFSEGLWFLYTDKNAKEINEDIQPLVYSDLPLPEGEHISHHDIVFICEIGEDYDGFFFKNGFEWLKTHKNKI